MKKRMLALLLVAIMLLHITPAIASPLSNYDFEGHLPDSVLPYGNAKLSITDSTYYTGKSSLMVSDRRTASDGLHIDLTETAKKGAKYTVTAWLYLPEGSVSGKMGVYLLKNDTQEYKVNLANISSGQWTKISGSVSPDLASGDKLKLAIYSADGNKSNFCVDCISINIEGGATEWTISQEADVNLLADSSFESGTTGAAFKRFSTINVTDTVAKDGKYAVEVTNRNETFSGIELDVKDLLKEGSTYRAGVSIKLKDATPDCHMYFQLEIKSQGQDVHYPIIDGGKVNSNSWTDLSGLIHTSDFTYPLERAKMYVASMDENKSDFYVDNFSLCFTEETGEEDKDKITEFPDQPVNLPVMPVYINWYDERQTIDGFGASGAFGTANNIRKMSPATQDKVLDMLFTDEGAGLTILRNRINPEINPQKGVYDWSQGEDQIWLMKEAEKRGVPTIMSTAWTPPAWMKTTGSVIGGELKEECYGDYARYLAEYIIQYQKQFGITIDVISMANEPNLSPEYDGCLWSDKQITKWIRDYAAPVFAEMGIAAQLMAAEDMNFSEARVADALLDPQAVQHLDIVGVHGYGGGYSKLSVTENAGKPIWMTEVLGYHECSTEILDGLVWAKRIHQHMSIANVSAWNYWYAANTEKHSNGALLILDIPSDTFIAPKRFYAIANYSKFVKPGDVRISSTMEPGENVYITAFKNKQDKKLTFVAVNGNVNQQSIKLNLNGASADSFKAYLTDKDNDLKQIADVKTDSVITLPPRSVTTFVANVTETDAVDIQDYMGADLNVKLPEIQAVYGTPTIDGTVDSVWAQASSVNTEIWGDGSVNTTGAQAQVKTMWDENYYYVLMNVKDNKLSAESADVYMQDCVEIFLDENNAHTGFYQQDDVQYRINCFNEISLTDNCDAKNFKSVVVKTDTGYIVEAAVPFTTVTPKVGTVMGTEFQVTDEYPGNTRSISKWATDSGSSYCDTSTFGILRLVQNVSDEIKVILNGKQLVFDVAPVLVNDRTMIPFRKIFEEMGAQVDYIDAEQKVIAKKDGLQLEFVIGTSFANVNTQNIPLDAAPFVTNGRTLVPLRFVAETLGATVEWVEDTNTVIINN